MKENRQSDAIPTSDAMAAQIIEAIENGVLDAHLFNIAKACVARRDFVKIYDPLRENLTDEVIRILSAPSERGASRKIEAIRCWHAATGDKLAASKAAVEYIQAQHNLG